MNERTLQSLAVRIGFASLWDFIGWSMPYVLAGMQILGAILPMAVAAPTGSMNPAIDGGDRLLYDAGVGDVERGDVIVYHQPEGPDTSHCAHFYGEAGENWYGRADPDAVGDAQSCSELRTVQPRTRGESRRATPTLTTIRPPPARLPFGTNGSAARSSAS